MGVGGQLGKQLRRLAERHETVALGQALSLGGPAPLDRVFLLELKQFLDAHDYALYTEHLSYCSDEGHLYDLYIPSPSPNRLSITSPAALAGLRIFSNVPSLWKTLRIMFNRLRRK